MAKQDTAGIWEGGRREKERRRTERKEIFKAGRAGNRESGKRTFAALTQSSSSD